jgi:hypothetical protein
MVASATSTELGLAVDLSINDVMLATAAALDGHLRTDE